MEMTDVKLTFTIPYGKPDKNGMLFTEEAVMAAVSCLPQNLPIKLSSDGFSKVIGHTTGKCHLVRWNPDMQTCHITVDGKLYAGGIDGEVNECDGNAIKDFDIQAFSLTSE